MTNTDNLSLTVINDGSGEQCGASYGQRCNAFSTYTKAFKADSALTWVIRANSWMQKRGHEGETTLVILQQAAEVAKYYEQHVKEM